MKSYFTSYHYDFSPILPIITKMGGWSQPKKEKEKHNYGQPRALVGGPRTGKDTYIHRRLASAE